jgi:hypothetical protein
MNTTKQPSEAATKAAEAAEAVRLEYVARARKLAALYCERAKLLRYKGRRADESALDFFSGATCAAEQSGELPFAQYLSTLNSLIFAVRGMIAVARFAAGFDD